jgi:hypothetical protein
MTSILRFVAFGILYTLALLAFSNSVVADTHHDGQGKLGNRINQNGVHPIHTQGQYTFHATVQNGKVRSVHSQHPQNGKAFGSMYKTKVKKHIAAAPGREVTHVFVSDETEDNCQAGFLFIGFGFQIGGQFIVFWFPLDWVAVSPDDCQEI